MGIIPGVKKTGKVSYCISASDYNGKVITSDEYTVEIINNDVVIIDSQYDEVIESNAKIYIDEKELKPDTKPVVKIGRTLVPVRGLSEALKSEVTWDEKTRTVNITKDNKTIRLTIGQKSILVDNSKKDIDVPAIIIKDRTMLPARIVCEMLGAEVKWDETSNRIDIISTK
jgi:exo-beta-1,3-glucanase (GH17 family)